MPLVSIVMPTRNRAHLLRLALETALSQTFADFEVVVSDNSSTDDTASVVRERGSERIHYIRTETRLPMPESWEFALAHARGTWVTFLSDDDALRPDALGCGMAVLDATHASSVIWRRAKYYHPTWPDARMRNHLIMGPCSGRVVVHESSRALRDLYNLTLRTSVPMLTNSLIRRDILESARNTMSRLFLGPGPDYAAAVVALLGADQFYEIDDYLGLFGYSEESTGACTVAGGGRASQQFEKEFASCRLFSHVPLDALTVTNANAETLLAMKAALPDRLKGVELDWAQYYINCHRELISYRDKGKDVSKEIHALVDLLARQERHVQERFHTSQHRLSPLSRLKLAILRWIARHSALVRAASAFGAMPASLQKVEVHGAREGFSNIAECALKLQGLVRALAYIRE